MKESIEHITWFDKSTYLDENIEGGTYMRLTQILYNKTKYKKLQNG